MSDLAEQASVQPEGLFAGGGEMGALMRALDWPSTPLGPVEGWPQALKTCVRIMLTSRQPMWLGWGAELTFLYNDPYRSIVGGKHPQALGQPTAVVWREIWADIAPRIRSALGGDEGTYDEALLLIMERYGYPEETYYTFSYSPIPDDQGRAGGIFCANTDDTRRVIGERQLALLRDLAAGLAGTRTIEDTCALSARILATNLRDLPFALIYLLDPDHRHAVLSATSNVTRGDPAAPEAIALDDDRSLWPIAEVVRTNAPCLIADPAATLGALPAGAWDRPPAQAVALPIAASGESGQAGVLIVGLNPYRLFDDRYQSFLGLVAGQIAAAIATTRAYEEERRRAEALAELDRAKTAFFSNVSHEFRTPLTLLLGPLEEALAAPPQTPLADERAQLESAHRNSLRLLRLVNTLLDFSRIEAGRAEASYEPTDLAALTAELAGTFRSAIERAGLRLVVDCPPLPEPVYVDREMWEKVVLNLLSNAFKFTFQGEIAVVLRAAGECVVLEVRDTGTGIPPEELPHLFERFHRVRDARGRTHEGTGIGLALVKDLAGLHGGTVGVESAIGVGSTFTVTLPLGTAHLPKERIGARCALASTSAGAAPYVEEALRWLPGTPGAVAPPNEWNELAPGGNPDMTGGARPRVLLADDNADMREYVTRLLSEHCAVRAVADGADALEVARTWEPDLVLSDIMMPRLDGVALVRALRADPRTRTLPIILLSARAGEEATAAGLEAGADDYLVKPFAASELLARVRAHAALARLRREAHDELVAERDRLQVEVAARTRAEEALQASRDHLQLALSAARMVAWEWDPAADAVTTSENLADIYGISRIEASTQGFPLVHPDDRARHEATVARAAATASGYQSTFRIIRPDNGELVWLEERGVAVYDESGAFQKLTGIAMDVSDRERAEAGLRQQAALIALAHDAIIVRDRGGRIMAWNDGATALYGWTAEEAIGRVTHDLLRTRVLSSGKAGSEVDVALAAHAAWEGDLEHTRRDGTRVVVESRQSLLRAADGTPEAILEVNRDAGPRLELAAALARLETLQAVSDALAQLELPALLRQVLEHITAALAADNTAILLLDETERTLTVYAAQGPEEAQTGQMRVPVGQGVAGRIAETQQPLIVADLRSSEPVNPLLREQMASLMGVPLLVEGRLIGVMHVDSATPRQFTDDDLHLLQLVADRVALALDNARLYRDALEARDLVARLQRVTAGLSAAATTDEVADVIIAQGLEALGAATGTVAVLADDGASFTTLRVAGYAPGIAALWPDFPADAAVPIADAVRAREPVIMESREEHDAHYPHLAGVHATAGDGALVAIPLLLGERIVGGLGLSFEGSRLFATEERAIMGALGELCAQALERAHLYEAERQARAEAETERRHLREVFEQAPALIAVVRGPGHVYEVVNPLAARAVGRRDPSELVGRPVREALPELEGQGYFELLDQVYASGEPFVGTEMPMKLDFRGDGTLEEIIVNFVYQPYRDADGAVEGIFVHAVDVTEQVRARERVEELARQMQDERGRWRQVLDVLPVGVVIVDAHGRVEVLNQAGRDIVGLDTRGQPLPTPGDDAAQEYRVRRPDGTPYPPQEVPLRRSLLLGEEVRGDQELHRHAVTGRETPLLVNSSPLRDGAGAIVGAVAVFQDITALRDLERAREEFLSSAAHDLKTPLTGIRGHTQLAQRRLARLTAAEAAPIAVSLAHIDEGIERMLGLINELLDVTRLHMGTALHLDRAPTDLVALVRGVAARHDAAAPGRLRVETALPTLEATVDAARLERVVENLLSNALRYSPEGTEITIGLAREERETGADAVLSVCDHGIGIPMADLPRIFDRFYRAGNVAGRVLGTGIGLASARQIVEQHGGSIAVESAEGAGSTFTVRIPLAAR